MENLNRIDSKRLYKEIGRRIFEKRDSRKYTQEQLAEKLSLTRASVSNIEKGKHRLLIHTLLEIAGVLEVKYEELIPEYDISTKREDPIKYPEGLEWAKSVIDNIEEEK